MGGHPLNLTLRFFLELAALYCIGYWGWNQYDGLLRYLMAFGLPFLAAVIWGTFRVPGDGGAPRVRVSGIIRFLMQVRRQPPGSLVALLFFTISFHMTGSAGS
jgi:hypothetical protein